MKYYGPMQITWLFIKSDENKRPLLNTWNTIKMADCMFFLRQLHRFYNKTFDRCYKLFMLEKKRNKILTNPNSVFDKKKLNWK